MSNLLKSLKVSKHERVSTATTSDTPARDKLVERLEEQIKLATAIEGEPYLPTTFRYIADEDGKKVKTEVPRKARKWFWAENGTYYMEVRYSNIALDLKGKGKGTTIEVGTLADLIPTITTIRDAVKAGELDTEVNAVAKQVAARRSKK